MNLDVIRSLPGIVQYRKAKYRRRFQREGTHNLFWGAFGSFAEAVAAAPGDRPLGYDNPDSARMYESLLDTVFHEHYPTLFWLATLWPDLRSVLDFGGHRGSLFYAAHRHLGPGPVWTVYDVPTVVEEGRKTARERGATGLRFADRLPDVDPPQLVAAVGSLQYVELSADQWLDSVPGTPEYVIVNTTPFHASDDFVTLNNIGTAYCPYRIRCAGTFFGAIEERGYRLVESWVHAGKHCRVPFHYGGDEIVYRGAYFRRA